VRDAFAVHKRKEMPKSVLLIDDVITTGATVNECARTLKQAGAEWVGALAFSLAGKPEKG
jgi:predicted amidophosphoribosyltransferase